MAFDITKLTPSTITTGLAGKIIGIYGLNNTGKSYVSARLFPSQTLWLATEPGYHAISGMNIADVENWGDFRSAVSQLTTRNKKKREEVRKMYKCVVVDVADRLPNLATAYIINRYNDEKSTDNPEFKPITELSGIPYGGGYSMLNKEFDTQLTKLTLSGYCVVLIFHEEVRKMEDNHGKEYDYVVPKNTFSKAGNALKDIPDFMIYLESQGVDEEGKPVLSIGHTVQHKEFFARSRFTECPPIIAPFTAENLKETVKIACEREAEKLGAVTVTFEEEEAAREEVKAQKRLTLDEAKAMIKPVFAALRKAKLGSNVDAIVNSFLGDDDTGKARKISEVTDDIEINALQAIYDKLVDLAEEKEIEWEE